MIPPRAASVVPMIQTRLITCSTSIPEADASPGLSAMARLALPIRDFSSQVMVAARARMAMPEASSDFGVMATGPNSRPA